MFSFVCQSGFIGFDRIVDSVKCDERFRSITVRLSLIKTVAKLKIAVE